MTDDEQKLFDQVPKDGEWVTNPSVRDALGWDNDRYWSVRNSLIDKNLLAVARGRGGLVSRIVRESPELETGEVLAPATTSTVREDDLYTPIASVLDGEWAKEKRLERWIVHITARQGRRETGGKWSRPDLVVLTQTVFPYVPGKHFDVITFEVKPADALDVTSIYEALAHLRAATKAYVLLHVPDAEAERLGSTLTEVCAEAKRHGIGVVSFAQADDFDSWNELVEPIRREPDPRRLNDFLATQFEPGQLDILLRWFR